MINTVLTKANVVDAVFIFGTPAVGTQVESWSISFELAGFMLGCLYITLRIMVFTYKKRDDIIGFFSMFKRKKR